MISEIALLSFAFFCKEFICGYVVRHSDLGEEISHPQVGVWFPSLLYYCFFHMMLTAFIAAIALLEVNGGTPLLVLICAVDFMLQFQYEQVVVALRKSRDRCSDERGRSLRGKMLVLARVLRCLGYVYFIFRLVNL